MIFTEQKFENQTIHLDFNRFVRCNFEKCQLVYHGSHPPQLEECNFNNVQWSFAGAAGQTLNVMAALYHGGAKELIEQTFTSIKAGKTPQAAVH